MLSKVNFTSALKAGIVGSVIMTVIMYSLPGCATNLWVTRANRVREPPRILPSVR